MRRDSVTLNKAIWFLVGPYDSAETVRHLPIYTLPFLIGRRQDLTLALSCKTVSNLHAEIIQSGGALVLRDLGSTNGTYVNGKRLSGPVVLQEDDLVQFANMAYRVRRQAAEASPNTIQEDVCDRALALVQFDRLMAERAVTPYFQPIVSIASCEMIAYEALARSRLFGLETPAEMFRAAVQLNLEVELSVMLRWEAVEAGRVLPGTPHLFLNTHPRELEEPGLIASLEHLRQSHPDDRITLEIHEKAVTELSQMTEIRAALTRLDMGLAYDDFGAGQSRLNELAEDKPDCVKFDMSLIRDIHLASAERQEVLATLVQMVHKLGIRALAEGVETQGEHDACRAMGFDLGQGFFYGRPCPAREFNVSGDPA